MERWSAYQSWYTVPEEKKSEQALPLKTAVRLLVLLFSGMLLYKCLAVHPVTPATPTLTHHDTLQTFFKAHGSPVPSVMASAVLQTRNPNLMAAIAVKESNGTPWAVGDGGKSRGAFQVQSRFHGKVSGDPAKQALQAEKILEELVRASKGRFRRGLALYNGGHSAPRAGYVYADHVLKIKGALR